MSSYNSTYIAQVISSPVVSKRFSGVYPTGARSELDGNELADGGNNFEVGVEFNTFTKYFVQFTKVT